MLRNQILRLWTKTQKSLNFIKIFISKPILSIGFVKINDGDICVAVFVENILTYDVPEPIN